MNGSSIPICCSRRHVAFAAALVVACVAAVLACAQAPEGPRRSPLERAIAEVESGRQTTPIVGEPTATGDLPVTFLARRVGGRVPRIVSDVTGWGESADGTFDFTVGRMARVGQTDWYSLETRVAPRARVEYLLAYETADYRLDPHNPRHVESPEASEFVMPGYQPPREFADPPAASAGLTTETTLQSRVFGGPCRAMVYTPPGYRDDAGYPVAVFHGLNANVVLTGPSRVLDWLIAQRAIEPMVAAFVDSRACGHDHPTGMQMRAFLEGDLTSWLASRYGVAESADKRAIIAISYSAKDALDVALAFTDGFGRLGLLIPGRRITSSDIEAIADRRGRRLRVAILAGQYDQANVATARSLRKALADAGHTVDYTEVPEGHNPRTWLNNLRVVLVSLFGAGPCP